MSHVSLRIAAVAAALAAAAPASATNGMRMIGFGPIQNSMGGASAAAPLDSTTIVSNPAGMSALEKRVDLAGQAFMPSPKYSATWIGPGLPAPADSGSQSSDRPTDFVPTLGAVYKTGDRLTVGVAALGTTGMGVDYPAEVSPTAVSLYASRTLTSYMNMRLAPAVAYRLGDGVSVGLAANLMYAQMKYSVLDAVGFPTRGPAGSFGFGATVGISYRAPEKYTVAAAYETRSWFQDFSFDVPNGPEKLSFDQPDLATVGGSFRPLPALLIASDLQWIHWSSTNGKDQPALVTNPAQTGAIPFNLNWSDELVFKLGVQWDATKQVALRAGYNYGSNPVDPSQAFETIAFPAIQKHHFTVGGGYSFGAIDVNAAVVYAPTEKVSGANTAQGIVAYSTQMSQLAFELGASWKY